jgi:butyrate kinase
VDHPSNLGAPLAQALAAGPGCPAFVADPVSVDELEPAARLTGLPELPRRSLFHALNVRAVALRHAATLGRPLADLVLVVAHLGSGVSVALVRSGRVVDVNDSADEGPFSARRAGGLPSMALLELAERDPAGIPALRRRMMAEGGLKAHLGTADLAEAEHRAAAGNTQAALVLEALALQVAKAIGALAAAARGRVDGILITGGMARSERLVEDIAARLRWIAPVTGSPGEAEMEALAGAAARVLRGEEPALDWP